MVRALAGLSTMTRFAISHSPEFLENCGFLGFKNGDVAAAK
jgi:hypothetical protein